MAIEATVQSPTRTAPLVDPYVSKIRKWSKAMTMCHFQNLADIYLKFHLFCFQAKLIYDVKSEDTGLGKMTQ